MEKVRFVQSSVHQPAAAKSSLRLTGGSKVAQIGGGPAGSFFSYFSPEMEARVNLGIRVDIYE